MYDGEVKPPSLASGTGVLWELHEDAFSRWWNALPLEDRDEFSGVHGGDAVLARFVCALSMLTTIKEQPITGSVIVQAYAIAARLNVNLPDARVRAAKAWRNDAVQQLLYRLHTRSAQQAKARILNATTHLIEKMLNNALEAKVGDQAQAVKAALAFASMVEVTEKEERDAREKRGWKALLDSKKEPENVEEPSEEQAALYVKMLRDKLGEETFKRLTA